MPRIKRGDHRLGQSIIDLRKRKRMSQRALAGEMHIKPDKLIKIERGDQLPMLVELKRIGDAVRTTPEEWIELRRLWDQVHEPTSLIRDAQGKNAEEVFAKLYPVLYAAETPLSGGYARMSEIAASLADAYAGLEGKRVLDLGAGYGTTSIAISAFLPCEIVALDTSKEMIQLLRQILLSSTELDSWLRSLGADQVLGEFYERTLAHFHSMRQIFQGGLFRHNGGKLTPVVANSLAIRQSNFRQVDVIISNNALHWAINERRGQLSSEPFHRSDEEVVAQACQDALSPLASLLPPKGVCIIMEPKDFVALDDAPELDAAMEKNTFTEHPVFRSFHEMVNRILHDDYKITRPVPRTTKLFQTSQLSTLVQRAGFTLRNIHTVEWAYTCNPIDACFVRLPMLLGGVEKLSFDEKLAVGSRVHEELPTTLSRDALQTLIRVYWFYFVLERI